MKRTTTGQARVKTAPSIKDSRNAPLAARNLPDRIADYLIAKIYVGDLAAGQRLPSERRLAEILQVDRTSLRMALRQLSRMRLIASRPRSGIVVQDYRAVAGLDFLDAVLCNEDIELGAGILREMIAMWGDYVPRLFLVVNRKTNLDGLLAVYELVKRQQTLIAQDASYREIAEIEVKIHDIVINAQDSVLIRTALNSVRGLVAQLIYLRLEVVDYQAHVEKTMQFVKSLLQDDLSDSNAQVVTNQYWAYVRSQLDTLREKLGRLPDDPKLRTHRFPDIPHD